MGTVSVEAAAACTRRDCLARSGKRLYLSFAKGVDQTLRELAEDGQLVRVEEVVLSGSDVTQLGLRRLQKARATGSIDLSFTATTDAGVKHLVGLLELSHLNLWSTRVTSEGLCRLSGHERLKSLCLKATAVDDHGLVHLKRLGALRSLNLMETPVTEKGVRRLQAALPELSVLW